MAADALNTLTAQLLANAPPPPPSVWPPALTVWLGLLVLVGLSLGWLGYLKRSRRRRYYLRALRRVRRAPAQGRLNQLHALLRNAGGTAIQSLPADAFARQVATTLGRPRPPAWVNAHYRQRPVRIDWRDARRLIRRWCR